ncbi:hypothetical protein ADUPG1_007205 [Aduncisulcus paluster]|uniref:Uncharacterized protein n=1 Tax=Aduncisulcus paluster TaxID=2918883 RepID=A0ABQ5KL45_9EUKA|nr:hypothetical protein ADUPG1_007205 [Aduncisulcus paluster]
MDISFSLDRLCPLSQEDILQSVQCVEYGLPYVNIQQMILHEKEGSHILSLSNSNKVISKLQKDLLDAESVRTQLEHHSAQTKAENRRLCRSLEEKDKCISEMQRKINKLNNITIDYYRLSSEHSKLEAQISRLKELKIEQTNHISHLQHELDVHECIKGCSEDSARVFSSILYDGGESCLDWLSKRQKQISSLPEIIDLEDDDGVDERTKEKDEECISTELLMPFPQVSMTRKEHSSPSSSSSSDIPAFSDLIGSLSSFSESVSSRPPGFKFNPSLQQLSALSLCVQCVKWCKYELYRQDRAIQKDRARIKLLEKQYFAQREILQLHRKEMQETQAKAQAEYHSSLPTSHLFMKKDHSTNTTNSYISLKKKDNPFPYVSKSGIHTHTLKHKHHFDTCQRGGKSSFSGLSSAEDYRPQPVISRSYSPPIVPPTSSLESPILSTPLSSSSIISSPTSPLPPIVPPTSSLESPILSTPLSSSSIISSPTSPLSVPRAAPTPPFISPSLTSVGSISPFRQAHAPKSTPYHHDISGDAIEKRIKINNNNNLIKSSRKNKILAGKRRFVQSLSSVMDKSQDFSSKHGTAHKIAVGSKDKHIDTKLDSHFKIRRKSFPEKRKK